LYYAAPREALLSSIFRLISVLHPIAKIHDVAPRGRAGAAAGVGDEFRRTPATVAPHTAAGRATFATIFAENRLK
jgi:Na+/glutamate symporter